MACRPEGSTRFRCRAAHVGMPLRLFRHIPAFMMRGYVFAALLAVIVTLIPAANAQTAGQQPSAPPWRIVSLNLCADELVLQLAPREHIVSVTSLAHDPISSNVVELAEGIPSNRGLAEEIIPLEPDLVIAGAFTTRNTVATLQRFGIEVLDLGVPQSMDEAYAQIRTVSRRLGVPQKGEEMIRSLQAVIPPRTELESPAPRTVVVRPNGFTAGRDTLADDLMQRAGLDNVAARLSPDRLGQLPLEEIVSARPQVLVLDKDTDAPPSMAGAIMQHPALAHSAGEAQTVALPSRMWACVGPQLAEAYQRLAAGAQAARSAMAQQGSGHK